MTTTTRVNVRTGPSTSYKSLTILAKGTSLPSQGSSNGWTKVTYKGQTAYISSTYVSGSSSDAPPRRPRTAPPRARVGPATRRPTSTFAKARPPGTRSPRSSRRAPSSRSQER
ncbi:SH3 domain-containing protein [Tessaracoccus sp. HDW20]|nr:SH3 domain-containing protein [Tessaracoccus coleopterorum]